MTTERGNRFVQNQIYLQQGVADDQEVILGRLLIDVVHGDLTNNTI